jgi:hypothetical protein
MTTGGAVVVQSCRAMPDSSSQVGARNADGKGGCRGHEGAAKGLGIRDAGDWGVGPSTQKRDMEGVHGQP